MAERGDQLCVLQQGHRLKPPVSNCLSLWELTEEQPTNPLLCIFLPRLQVVEFILHKSPSTCQLVHRGAGHSHYERTFLVGKVRGSSFPLPPPHPPCTAPHICDILSQSVQFCCWNLPASPCPDISFSLK